MHPVDIQAQLKKRGVTQKDIADDLGVGRMAVSLVIRKKSVSKRIMKYVAQQIDRDPLEVFPEYFLQKKTLRPGSGQVRRSSSE